MSHARSVTRWTACALAVCLIGALPAAAAAGPGSKGAKAAPATKLETPAPPQADAARDTMMAEMMRLATPGPQHEALKASVGKWKAVVKSWSAPGEPLVSEGTSESRMILGGRYLEDRLQSTMMGQPFEGYGLTGYDNGAQRYWFFWVDNMSTSMMSGTGSMDEAGKTLTVTATTPGPDGKPTDVRMVTKFVDENTHVWSMYGMMGGQEMLMMEITYTRL
jgi:hypothetical protein